MEEKRVRICDIAEELGLSTATVSNVIHGKTKKISDETVQRVQALLEKRQYIPSMAGILLAQNDSKIIGVVINDHEKYEGHVLEDIFIASSLNCLSTEIERNGQFMMVKKTKDIMDIIKFASMWNMDGIIIIGFCSQDYMYLRNHMRIPFVVYDGYCENPERIYNITIDNYDGGYQIGQHFKNNGYEKVLCISDNEINVDRDRFLGFKDGFGGENIDFMLIPMNKSERTKYYEKHLKNLQSYDGIFAVSDYYAIDLIRFFTEKGIGVPQKVAVAGFDDTHLCQQISPTLTSVHQDVSVRAKIAIEKLKDLKNNIVSETTECLKVNLVVRESTQRLFCNKHWI